MNLSKGVLKTASYGPACDGNVALLFAVLAPVMIGLAGGAIDFWRVSNARGSLQQVADATAIAGAREYVLGQKRMDMPKKAAEATAKMQIEQTGLDGVAYDIATSPGERSVAASLTQVIKPSLMVGLFRKEFEIEARAMAVSYESANLCVLSLDPRKDERIVVKDEAVLTGNNCSVHANSSHTRGLAAYDFSKIEAVQTSVTGGYAGPAANFTPPPITDYPEKQDPLKARPSVPRAGCDENGQILEDFSGSIRPGVFCGGLRIKGTSDVEFEPGIYVIKDGAFEVSGESRIHGTGVGVYLTGSDARFLFLEEASVQLSGPVHGMMAGLLIYQDRNVPNEPDSEIRSPNVSELVGTIYLPRGDLYIDTESEVAQASAFTAIIVDELMLSSRAHLILNSDYDATDVPLPPGMEGPPVVGLRE